MCIEILLDNLKVPKTELSKKSKRKRLTLHSRIEKLSETHPNIEKHLLAIKWIGNDGSHTCWCRN